MTQYIAVDIYLIISKPPNNTVPVLPHFSTLSMYSGESLETSF